MSNSKIGDIYKSNIVKQKFNTPAERFNEATVVVKY